MTSPDELEHPPQLQKVLANQCRIIFPIARREAHSLPLISRNVGVFRWRLCS
jgi:hypothetical protein